MLGLLQLLKSYFKDVELVAQELAKQMWYIMDRCLEAVRGADPGPQQVVTVLRIIEREERFVTVLLLYCLYCRRTEWFLSLC